MGRLAVLVGKELRQVRWVLWVGLGLTLLFGLSLPYFYRFISRMVGAGAGLPGLPGDLIRQLADFRLYLWANWYGKNLYQNLTVIALLLGAGAVAGERARGTLPFLLTLPVSRRQVVTAKLVAGAVVLAACTVIPTVGVWVASPWLGGQSAPDGFLLGMPLAWAGSLVVLGLAALASVFAADGWRAGVVASLVCLVLAVPGWFRSTSFLSFFWHMKAFSLMMGRFPWGSLLVLLGAALVLFWAAAEAVCHRDV
jgi:ABC-2 type transport system permease protein